MKKYIQYSILGISSISLLLFTGCKDAVVTSHFKENDEGWKIEGDAQGASAAPTHSPTGGAADGYIHAKDNATGGVWYFSAPEKYLGEKSKLYGRTLSYSLYQKPVDDNQFDAADVILASGDRQVFHVVEEYPDTTWTSYKVKIEAEGKWFSGKFADKKTATEEEIRTVLSNLDKLWIRGEYRNGKDWGGLDEVQIE